MIWKTTSLLADKIILFSADQPLANNISSTLNGAGYKVVHRCDGIGAIDFIQAELPELVILDLELPGLNSLAIIRSIRAEETNGRLPIILTGTMDEDDVLIGLEVGADLCLREMYHPRVFLARVRSLLRRKEPAKVI